MAGEATGTTGAPAAGATGAPGEGGAQNATSNTPAPQSGSATPPAASTVPAWMAALSPEQTGWIQAKGVSDPGQLVEMWKGMERIAGHPKEQLAVIPSELKSLDDARPVLQRLGVPADAQGYKLEPDTARGGTPEFTRAVEGIFHNASLTAQQAAAVYQGWNAFQANEAQRQQEVYDRGVIEQKQSLATEWGAAHDQNVAVAKHAAKTFGVSETALNALEKSSSYADVMKLFNNIGRRMGEAPFVSGNPGLGTLSPEAAKAQREALLNDKAWAQAYLNGDAAKNKKMQELIAAEMGVAL